MAAPINPFYDPATTLNSSQFHIFPHGQFPPRDGKQNLGAFTNPGHELHLVQKPVPVPGKGQVVVHVRATGICGSDVHFWKHGRIGDMVVCNENGLGHESAGTVFSVGEGVTKWKVGDRVAIEAGVPCSLPSCDFCRTGRYNACPDVVFFSTPPYHGTLTRYHLHPAAWLHRLPDNVSFEEGALLEPLTVALAGIERSSLRLGDPLLICGAGPIGLVTLLCARASGAEPIVITDLAASRLEFAKQLVPSVRTILIKREETSKDVAKRVRATLGIEPSLALECTGVESSVHAAIYSVRFGGMVFVIGVGKEMQSMPFMHLSANEIDLKFQYRYANQYPKAIRLVSGGLLNLKPLVTHRYSLEHAMEAFDTASDITKGSIKVQILDEE
ncbi:GroES-like protein [Dacryopinax primogenitus]|uniref:L-arabinitol 4-dehydrogenase n=1 Tax=Dacryopinax primogenitus (strain DJM 731) TaxID=1858805 RepID=M5FYJ9_DACPD|nr:GroES-like protein [Dacryopinax primogenitus]EJT98621.1 GroES-like protein [Dacryopinax primogenitus]